MPDDSQGDGDMDKLEAAIRNRWLSRLLDRVPWKVIWFADEKFNHLRRGQPKCVWNWFCDYTDYRAFRQFPDDSVESGP